MEYISKLEYGLSTNYSYMREVDLLGLSSVNILLYGEYYEKLCEKIGDYLFKFPMREGGKYDLSLRSDNVLKLDEETVSGTLYIEKNRLKMDSFNFIQEKNTRVRYKTSTTVLNEIYEDEDYIKKIDLETYFELLNKDLNINSNPKIMGIDRFEYLDSRQALLQTEGLGMNLLDGEKSINIGENVIFLIMSGENSRLYLKNNSKYKNRKPMEGIVYINGDLCLENDVEFYGIIVVNGNICLNEEDISKLKTRGMIVSRDNLNLNESINYIYDRRYIYKYGIFLPDFFDFKIWNVRKN